MRTVRRVLLPHPPLDIILILYIFFPPLKALHIATWYNSPPSTSLPAALRYSCRSVPCSHQSFLQNNAWRTPPHRKPFLFDTRHHPEDAQDMSEILHNSDTDTHCSHSLSPAPGIHLFCRVREVHWQAPHIRKTLCLTVGGTDKSVAQPVIIAPPPEVSCIPANTTCPCNPRRADSCSVPARQVLSPTMRYVTSLRPVCLMYCRISVMFFHVQAVRTTPRSPLFSLVSQAVFQSFPPRFIRHRRYFLMSIPVGTTETGASTPYVFNRLRTFRSAPLPRPPSIAAACSIRKPPFCLPSLTVKK